MKVWLLASALVLAGAAAVHAQVPPLTLLTTTTTTTSTTTSTTEVEETSTSEPSALTPDVSIEPLPESTPDTAAASPAIGPTTSTRVVGVQSKQPRSSVASALTGAFAVALATVFAVAGIFVSLSIRSRVRR